MKCGKGRNRKGQWCLTETSRYKMTNHFGQFNEDAEEKFQEMAVEKYDFARCQRSDGSFYGTGGTCRKGSPVGDDVGKKEKKAKAKGGGETAAKKEAKTMVKIAGGDAEGMVVKGGKKIKPDAMMRNVAGQLEKEYGVKMDKGLANGDKLADGYIDGFVVTKSGNTLSVSMEHDGQDWVVEAMDVL